MIVRVIVVLKRTLVDNDCRFDNLCGSHIQRYITSVDGIKLWLQAYLLEKVLLAIVDKYPVRCNKDSTFIQSGVFRFS